MNMGGVILHNKITLIIYGMSGDVLQLETCRSGVGELEEI